MRPVDNKFPVSQGFGEGATQGVDPYSDHPMAALVRMYGNYQPFGHAGQDIACPVGTPVRAIANGRVLWAGWGTDLPGDESDRGYRQRYYLYKKFPGIVSVLQHSFGKGVYAHLSSNDEAPAGTYVVEGEVIGLSGDTGGVAPHLHTEVIIDDSYRTGGGLIYGRTDPTQFYGSAALAPAGDITSAPSTEKEDLEMLILVKGQDDAIWVGNYVTRRQVPDLQTLRDIQYRHEIGDVKIANNGQVIEGNVEVAGKAV